MTISIVIVNYHSEDLLRRLLISIQKQHFKDFEVIIVDNSERQRHSRLNPCVEVLARYHSNGMRISYIPNWNAGYAAGNNLGVHSSIGEAILILNPDTTLEKDALPILANKLQSSPENVAVVVPKIIISRRNEINSIGMRRIRPSENLYTNIGYGEKDLGQYNTSTEVEAFDGPAFLFRRKVLNHTYLFDPRFFFGAETIDFSERIRRIGFKIVTCPDAIVRHDVRGTVDGSQNNYLSALIVRNSLAHTYRNTSRSMFVRTLIIGVIGRNILGRIVTGKHPVSGRIYLHGLILFINKFGMLKNHPVR